MDVERKSMIDKMFFNSLKENPELYDETIGSKSTIKVYFNITENLNVDNPASTEFFYNYDNLTNHFTSHIEGFNYIDYLSKVQQSITKYSEFLNNKISFSLFRPEITLTLNKKYSSIRDISSIIIRCKAKSDKMNNIYFDIVSPFCEKNESSIVIDESNIVYTHFTVTSKFGHEDDLELEFLKLFKKDLEIKLGYEINIVDDDVLSVVRMLMV